MNTGWLSRSACAGMFVSGIDMASRHGLLIASANGIAVVALQWRAGRLGPALRED